jgi:hypothetical protein
MACGDYLRPLNWTYITVFNRPLLASCMRQRISFETAGVADIEIHPNFVTKKISWVMAESAPIDKGPVIVF